MPQIQSTQKLKVILKNYFQEFFPKDVGRKPKVAWCTSVGPAELLTSMGFKVYFPENHGAMLGATRLSNEYIPVANTEGFSPDICSYLTADVGAYLKKQTPLTKAYGIPSIPQPDLLVYNTNQCREVQDWFSFYSREFKVETYGICSPRQVDEMSQAHIDDVSTQIKELVPVAEKVTGKKFDIDQFREVVDLSSQALNYWTKFLATAKNTPSPITFFDGCIQMAPAVMMRGTQVALDYYRELDQEMQSIVATGEGAIPKEQVRLYWDGMPIWGKLRFFSDLFAKHNTNVVASTYCNSWAFDCFDAKDPFDSLAEGYTKIFINRSERKKEEELSKMVDEYGVDGLFFHDAKTCPNNSNSRFAMPKRLSKKLDIPNLIVNGDLNDLRCFSEDQTITCCEAFIEQIKEAKAMA